MCKKNWDIVSINKPYEELEVMHIDQLILECGMFTNETDLNGGYGCISIHNTEAPGCCYTFSCPIAVEMDEDDPNWEDGFSDGEWMKKHSMFKRPAHITK